MKKNILIILTIILLCALFLSSCFSKNNTKDTQDNEDIYKSSDTQIKKEESDSYIDSNTKEPCDHKYITATGICQNCDCSFWNGSVDTSWYSVLSTELTINMASEFAGFAQLVNEGTDFHDVTIKLGRDINLNGKEWTPIAFKNNFCGTLDGSGHSISNLKITKANELSHLGLFAKNKGILLNLNIINANINVSCSNFLYAGGLTASNEGTIKNCSTTGIINITSLENAFCIGGLVGINNSSIIEKCHSYIDITAQSEGKATEECSSGGLVGENYGGQINTSYSAGDICVQTNELEGYSACNVGGFVGTTSIKYGGIMGTNSIATIKNCYSEGNVSASMYANNGTRGEVNCGGFVGELDKGTIINCYSLGSSKAECYDCENCYAMADCFVGSFLHLDDNVIKNCFGIGDASATIDDQAQYGRSRASAFCGNDDISNCYYNNDMKTISTNDIYKAGTPAKISDFKAIEMYQNRLNWDAKIWNFTAGEYPTLK